MTKDDIIEPVEHPTDWVSPIVPVPKKEGGVCVEYRKLNLNIKREVFHIPTFEELTFKLSGAKVMSKLAAASGLFQIPLHEDSRDLTTFLIPFGLYKFKRLPMGVNCALEIIYQRKMFELLKDIEGVLIYMDDVIVFGNSKESHDEALKTVLNRIKIFGLKLNKDKCMFNKRKLEFLGHVISDVGVHISPSKIEAVKRLKIPKNSRDLRRILGMLNFLTRFIPNAQVDLSPLNNLLNKNIAWVGGPSQQQALDKIKSIVSSSPVLAYFDPTKPIAVSTDSSSYALGGVLF